MRTRCRPPRHAARFRKAIPNQPSRSMVLKTSGGITKRLFGTRRAISCREHGGKAHASCGNTHGKRRGRRRLHWQRKDSGNARHSLALPTVVSPQGLSVPGQCSGRGRCGARCTTGGLQTPGPIQGASAIVDMAHGLVTNSARMQLRRRPREIHLSLDEQLGDEEQFCLSQRLADRGPTPEEECRKSELRERLIQFLPQLSPHCARPSSCVTSTA